MTHGSGPMLVLAGAGSGKTRVITRRVAWLMTQGVRPPEILAITFTNKAAGEMKSRVGALLGRELRDFGRLDQPWPIICTFHSLGLRILRHYAQRIGLPADFTVYDAADAERMLRQAMSAAELDASTVNPALAAARISMAKNRLRSAEQFASEAGDVLDRWIARIYAAYEKLMAQNKALDFDDLLMRACTAMRDFADVRDELQQRFAHILIDEYQDTNHAQYVLAHALAGRHRNIVVVGDPDQSIYAWRGADISNILEFEQDYPDARVIRLERNYRSTGTILHIASRLIAHNRRRKRKDLWTENDRGRPALLLHCMDERDEARAVAQELRAMHEKEGYDYGQMAVFYRINALSRVMEDALRDARVPYRIARGVDFFHRKEIKDVLAYLRVVANPDDDLSMERIINVPPRGLGDVALSRLRGYARSRGVSLWQAMREAETAGGLSPRAAKAVASLVTMIGQWRARAGGTASAGGGSGGAAPIRQLMEDIVAGSGLEKYLRQSASEDSEELANVNELITHAAQFDAENPQGTLRDYLAQVSLVSDIDMIAETGGAVTLMTLHAAKGLEFPVVAIIGMEEGILPHQRVETSPAQLEEERRLCFVGITRTRERLIMSHAWRRTIRGISEDRLRSRFLDEMPEEAIEECDSMARRGERCPPATRHGNDELADGGEYAGRRVRHPRFGTGKVRHAERAADGIRVVVEFPEVGLKTLMIPPAVLEIID